MYKNLEKLFILFLFFFLTYSQANIKDINIWFNKKDSSLNTEIDNLSDKGKDQFTVGRSFFTIPWVSAPAATTARDGLGPLFNSNTCISCHHGNGLGEKFNKYGQISRAMITKLSRVNGKSIDNYGKQIDISGNINVMFEGTPTLKEAPIKVTYPDGKIVTLYKPTYGLTSLNYGPLPDDVIIVQRRSPALVGLGLLEKVSDEEILSHADPKDINKDGISGKANWILRKDGRKVLGRFTAKASEPSVLEQTAFAAAYDMGLTNPFFPNEKCTRKQKTCINAPKGRADASGETLDLPMARLYAITKYISSTKVPIAKLNAREKQGKKIFEKIKCDSCHLSKMVTNDGIEFSPYTDLLLHDMGSGLADNRVEHSANGREFRTAPLWGLSTYSKTLKSKKPFYLHDARARTVEEAILWHGGEAKKSKKLFMKLAKNERDTLLSFLNKL